MTPLWCKLGGVGADGSQQPDTKGRTSVTKLLQSEQAAEVARRQTLMARAMHHQQYAIDLLRRTGTELGMTVDAGALAEVARDRCSNDYGHGPATCMFPATDRDEPLEALCPGCTAEFGKRHWLAGQHISVDVLL